jgi:CubicO group peptidase (beta-lactamase class C family)
MKKFKRILFVFIVFLLTSLFFAGTVTATMPPTKNNEYLNRDDNALLYGMVKGRDADNLKILIRNMSNSAMDATLAKYKTAGAAVMIIDNGNLLLSAGFGNDGTGKAPSPTNTLFEVCSISKPIVEWAITNNLSLLGNLNPDSYLFSPIDNLGYDPRKLSTYFSCPFLPNLYLKTKDNYTNVLTVRNIMHHKAGLYMYGLVPISDQVYPAGWTNPSMVSKIEYDLSGTNNSILSGALSFNPNYYSAWSPVGEGTAEQNDYYYEVLNGDITDLVKGYHYCNGGYGLLQLLINNKYKGPSNRPSNKPNKFLGFMDKVLQEQLDMKNTFYGNTNDILLKPGYNFAKPYIYYNNSNNYKEAEPRYYSNLADGVVYGTVEDFSKFIKRIIADNNCPDPNKWKSLYDLYYPVSRFNYYCNEGNISEVHNKGYFTFGSHSGYFTMVAFTPDDNSCIIAFFNTNNIYNAALGYGTGNLVAYELLDAWMIAKGHGNTLRNYHLNKGAFGQTVKSCERLYN